MRIALHILLAGLLWGCAAPLVMAQTAPPPSLAAMAPARREAAIRDRIRQVETSFRPLPQAAGQPSTATLTLAEQMRRYRVPGLSLAVVNEGRLEWAKGYGVTEKGGAAVTSATLFQAGSVSKSVMAVGVMRLVEQGRLALDADVNQYLKSWRMPENEFTKTEKVTVRRLLSHTAGVTVHGFSGYARTSPLPTLPQILDGEAPANSPAIRVDYVPGSLRRYSGGGYTILQQLVIDVTGKDFAQFMHEEVLAKAGMRSSTYQQPLPEPVHSLAAAGHRQPPGIVDFIFPKGPRLKVEGGWHVYPEQAAAGLWTTPADLARFMIVMQNSMRGSGKTFLSPATAKLMITPIRNQYGLGLHADGEGESLRFSHGGINDGFDTRLIGLVNRGQGAVMMMNANDSQGCLAEIQYAIARVYGWPVPAPEAELKMKK